MIDFANEIYDTFAKGVKAQHKDCKTSGEYIRTPSAFPAATLDEIKNVSVDRLEDSSNEEKFAEVGYRLQVFSNKQKGKKAEARAIFATADSLLRGMGLKRKTFTTTPEFYNSTIYSITATYEGTISADGVVYGK